MTSSTSGSGGSYRTKPSMKPDPSRKPKGKPKWVNPRESPENVRALKRQNESAKLLAENGYDIEQLQETHKAGSKQPDYNIEGLRFDHYAPSNARARNITDTLQDKIDKGQAVRFIINMDDTPVTIEGLKEQLVNWKVEGLEEVILVRIGKVIPFYPFE
jgi:hypothetical protein